MLDASLTDEMRGRVRVMAYAGLIAPYAESLGACALVRGMRPYADADSEIALALMNQKLAPTCRRCCWSPAPGTSICRAAFVRETATLGGLIVPGSVPPPVEEALRKRFAPQRPDRLSR